MREEMRKTELWNPLTGERKQVTDGRIRLKPYEGIFVIAKDKT